MGIGCIQLHYWRFLLITHTCVRRVSCYRRTVYLSPLPTYLSYRAFATSDLIGLDLAMDTYLCRYLYAPRRSRFRPLSYQDRHGASRCIEKDGNELLGVLVYGFKHVYRHEPAHDAGCAANLPAARK